MSEEEYDDQEMMMDEEEDDMMMEEDEEEMMMEEEDEGDFPEEPQLKHQTTQQIGHDYDYEIMNQDTLLNSMMSKVKKLEN